jgi:hypothetical protein
MKPSTLKQDNFNPEWDSWDSEQLTDQMTYELAEMFKEKGIENDSFKIGYSLSNCQGDGVCFTEGKLYRKDIEKLLGKTFTNISPNGELNAWISHEGRYQHEKSFYVTCEMDEPDGDMPDWSEAECVEVEKEILSELQDLCKRLEKLGYVYIDNWNNDKFLEEAFEDFKRINNIEADERLYDFLYVYVTNDNPEDTTGFTLVWQDTRTVWKAREMKKLTYTLYVKINPVKHTREVTYYTL